MSCSAFNAVLPATVNRFLFFFSTALQICFRDGVILLRYAEYIFLKNLCIRLQSAQSKYLRYNMEGQDKKNNS